MSIQSHALPHSHAQKASTHPAPPAEKGGIAFPTAAHDDAAGSAPEYWDGRAPPPQHRTVRRKKSSFDLRHVFKNGGVVPAPAAHAVSML